MTQSRQGLEGCFAFQQCAQCWGSLLRDPPLTPVHWVLVRCSPDYTILSSGRLLEPAPSLCAWTDRQETLLDLWGFILLFLEVRKSSHGRKGRKFDARVPGRDAGRN